MAITNLHDLDTNTQLVKVRHLQGVGDPNTDSTLGLNTDHATYPVFSTFLDVTNAEGTGVLKYYVKTKKVSGQTITYVWVLAWTSAANV